MTNNNHPITVPPELVKQMATKNGTHYKDLSEHCQIVADQAARWGADWQLEQVLHWLRTTKWYLNPSTLADLLEEAMRPQQQEKS